MSSISELFDKDPLSLTKTDIREIVEYMRKARLAFKQGDKTAGNPKKTKEKITLDAIGELDL